MGVESRGKPLCLVWWGRERNSRPISLPCLFSLILFLPHMMLAPGLRLQQRDALGTFMHAARAVPYLSLYLLCRHVAHDMGNRALDPKAPTPKPLLRGIPYTTQYRHIPCSFFASMADAPTASVTHIDVSLPAGITIATHPVLCIFRKRYFWLKVDARRNPLSDRLLGSACAQSTCLEDSKKTPF